MAEQRRKSDTGSLLFVQSAVCGVVLLIALIVRLIGGGFYEEVRSVFRNALTDVGLADTVSTLLSAENSDA